MLKKYEREIKELKQELQMHDTLNNRTHIQYEPYSESQRQELQQRIKSYLEDEEDELEVMD
jgi:kinesin family protein 6/9